MTMELIQASEVAAGQTIREPMHGERAEVEAAAPPNPAGFVELALRTEDGEHLSVMVEHDKMIRSEP